MSGKEKAKQVEIASASFEQLQAYCDMFGLEYHHRAGEEKLRETIFESGYTLPTIPDLTGFARHASPNPAATTGYSGYEIVYNKEGVACIPLQLTVGEGEYGERPVPVGPGGRITLIPRGRAVPVPLPHCLVLVDAYQTTYDPPREGQSALSNSRSMFSYPFAIVPKSQLLDGEWNPEFEPTEKQHEEAVRLAEIFVKSMDKQKAA